MMLFDKMLILNEIIHYVSQSFLLAFVMALNI